MAILSATTCRSTLAFTTLLVLISGHGVGAQTSCDASVTPMPGNDGYRLRSDNPVRCEGVYRRSVSGRAVYFMAWAWSRIDYELDDLEDITVSWKSPEQLPVSLRVEALPGQNLAYRMDVDLPPGTERFTWPATLLRRHQVDSRRFQAGAVMDLGSESPYLPVRVNAPDRCAESNPQLVLFSGMSIRNIVATVHRAAALDGEPVVVDTLIGSRPPGRFVVPVGGLTEPGVYRVTIEAEVRTTRRPIRPELYWIYHPGTWEEECLGR